MDVRLQMITLDNEYFAWVTDSVIEILQWTELTESLHVMVAVVLCEKQLEWVCFLPGARVVAFTSSNMVIYEIPSSELVPAPPSPAFISRTPYTWRIPRRGHGPMAVAIPTFQNQPLSLTKLGLHRYGRQQFMLGFHNSVVYEYSSITALIHKWTEAWDLELDDGTANTTTRLCPIPSGHQASSYIGPRLDEAPARLVLDLWKSGMFLVVDFAEIAPYAPES
ncbi:hypothetical protein BD779DRAFT_1733425 [Infundibulicybe gibba]|nr:hypothetical protein BD779DRAFT_1733425 [Infundibulicybe gibba]